MLIRDSSLKTALIPLILLMVAIALAGINADPIWFDEYLSLRYSGFFETQIDFAKITSLIVEEGRGEALLFDYLLAAWSVFAGWTAFAGRYLSLLFGVLAIAWVYRLGADLHSPFAGFCSAILLGASAFYGVYLHEIRTYSLLTLEVPVLIWLYLRVLHSKNARFWSALFVVVAFAALYSHPFLAPMIAALGLYHIALAPRTSAWARMLALIALSCVIFFPYALITIGVVSEFASTNPLVMNLTNMELISALAHATSSGQYVFLLIPLFTLLQLRRGGRAIQMLWFLGLAFCAIMLFANHVSSVINQVRYFMPLLPLFWLLGGVACASLRRYRIVVVLVLFVWCVAGYIAEPAFRKNLYNPDEYTLLHVAFPIDEIIQDIRSESTASDAIAFEFPYRNWVMQGIIGYYMRGANTRYVLTDALGNNEEKRDRFVEFRHFLGAAGRVYFVVDRTIVSSDFLEQYKGILSARYVYCGRLWDSEQATVDKYARVQALCEPPAVPLLEYQSPLALLEFRQEQSAKGHFLYSTWSTDLPADRYSLSLRILDSAGELNYQLDDALPLGEFNYRIDHIPLESLPPDSEFHVEVAVYDWRTGDRLRAADGADIVTVYQSTT